MNQNKLNEEVVRLVRKHINENGLLEGQENEPREPFPQDCCGQSCKPCVFDIHFDDVVRWAKEYSKYIISGDRTLYEQFFEKKELSEDSKIWFFSQYRSLEISDLKNLNSHTVLVRFRTPQPVVLPISSHIRIRENQIDQLSYLPLDKMNCVTCEALCTFELIQDLQECRHALEQITK